MYNDLEITNCYISNGRKRGVTENEAIFHCKSTVSSKSLKNYRYRMEKIEIRFSIILEVLAIFCFERESLQNQVRPVRFNPI